MIITVTLNAAIDKTLAVPNFRLGRRHRAVEQTAMAGGKGVNVARALRALGQPVIATGVAGGPTGTRIVEHLTEEGILNDFVRIREESRTSTAVVDPTGGEQTEINEHGPHVTEAELELFIDKLLYLAKGAAVCVISGSLPRGVDAGLYGRFIDEMKRLGVLTVLDSEGEPMNIATRKGPHVVTPNELEAEGPEAPRRHGGPPDSVSVVGGLEGVAEVSGRRIACGERRQTVTALDCGQDRGRVVGLVVHEVTSSVGRDHERRDARSRTPAVHDRRRHVIPEAAVLVIGDDDRGVPPLV